MSARVTLDFSTPARAISASKMVEHREAFERVGGYHSNSDAYRLESERLAGGPEDGDLGDRVVRYRTLRGDPEYGDDSYDPFRLRVDGRPERLVAGAVWDDHLAITHRGGTTWQGWIDERWSVEAIDETISVPAGTFVSSRAEKDARRNDHLLVLARRRADQGSGPCFARAFALQLPVTGQGKHTAG